MPFSMTGFGSAKANYENRQIVCEIKSLNSKFCDLSLRMPNQYKAKELELRSFLTKRLERGKIEVSIRVEQAEGETGVSIDQQLAAKYFADINGVADQLEVSKQDVLKLVLGMPEVIKKEKNELNEEEWKVVVSVVDEAITSFESFRSTEGEQLKNDLIDRINAIGGYLTDVIAIDDSRVQAVRDRIKANLAKLEEKTVDENRFEQELIYYIEKLDITEEKVRLKQHLDYFTETAQEKSCGKKIGRAHV